MHCRAERRAADAAVGAAAGGRLQQQRGGRAQGRARAGVRRHGRHRAARGGRVGAERGGGGRGGGRARARRLQLGRRVAPVRVPALRQALPLEVHAAAARERGVRGQAAGAPVPLLQLPRQAARQPGRARAQAPPRAVAAVRRSTRAPPAQAARLATHTPHPTTAISLFILSRFCLFVKR